jgi:zinc/manganese transport system permease protein
MDPIFLRTVSQSSSLAHYAFLALAVLNLVGGFHALGTLMAVGIMILPAAAARFWARQIGGLVAVALVIGMASCVAGLLLSFYADLPSGPAIVLTAGGFYALSLGFGPVGSFLARYWVRPHLEA